MNTNETIILSLTKRDSQLPWSIKVELPSGLQMEVAVGTNGKIPAGALLEETLKEVTGKINQYPFHYEMNQVEKKAYRTAQVRFLGEKPSFIEVGVLTANFIKKDARPSTLVIRKSEVLVDEELSFFSQVNQENSRMQLMNSPQLDIKKEFVGRTNRFWIFMESKNVQVVDGDTLSGYISGFGWPNGSQVPDYIGKQKMSAMDESVLIRMLGIDAFEVDDKNDKKAKNYGVDNSVLNEAAQEAKTYLESLISQGNVIAISLQYDMLEGKAVPEHYERLLGVVYATDFQNWPEAISAAESGSFKAANLNKEMLKPLYSRAYETQKIYSPSILVPLVEYVANDYVTKNDGLLASDWGYELGLRTPPTEELLKDAMGNIDEKDQEQDDAARERLESQENLAAATDKGNTRQSIATSGYVNNDLSFVPPYDDRVKNGDIYKLSDIQDDKLPWDYENMVRIGDVLLTIPPLSIRMDKQYMNDKTTTLRAKSSLQKNIGNVRNVLTMELYFHDLENINGYKVDAYQNEEGRTISYYMDGLRPLLAQFKKAPFLPIDNEYINRSLGVHNVVLHSIQASTVPGMPQSMKATIILEEFDSAPYLMGQTMLGDKINYPLLRWHYQRSLTQPLEYEPWRTYLPEVTHLDNSFTFSVIDEEQLRARKEALREFRSLKTPYEYKSSLVSGDEEVSKRKKDGIAAQKALKQYETFLRLWEDGNSFPIYKKYKNEISDAPVIAGKLLDISDYFHSLTSFNASWVTDAQISNLYLEEGRKAAIEMYGENPKRKKTQSVEVPLFNQNIIDGVFGADPSSTFYTMGTVTEGQESAGNIILYTRPEIYLEVYEDKLPGFFQLYFESDEVKALFKGHKEKNWNSISNIFSSTGKFSDTDLFFVPANDEWVTILKQVADFGEQYDSQVENYENYYNSLVSFLNQTEENMRMVPMEISDLIPIDLTVALTNNFSSVQVQTASTPTLQFLGSQDPEVQITFETSSKGVEQIENMFRKIGSYVKEYREGIVSGFMSVNNAMVNLFGIQSLMPQAVQYNTVEGSPDRKNVVITCTAFDKSQRRQEALYGYTAGDTREKMKDRAYDNYNPGKDSMYVHEQMRQMELYPDMELPLVKELEEELPYLNSNVKKWENRTDQVYVDPDFYISTGETYRNFIKDELDDTEGINVVWEDAGGYIANSSLSEAQPLQMSGDETARWEEEAASIELIRPDFTWQGNIAGTNESDAETQATTIETIQAPREVIGNKTVASYYSEGRYKHPPSFSEWSKWQDGTPTQTKYQLWKRDLLKPIPEDDVWFHLADLVITHFGPHGLEYAYLKNEKEAILEKKPKRDSKTIVESYYSSTALGKLVKYNSTEYYEKAYKALYVSLSGGTRIRQMKNGRTPSDAANDTQYLSDDDSTSLLDTFTDITKMPFQRVMMYLRAIMTVESKWRQFDDQGKPLLFNQSNNVPTKVGIMGARLSLAKEEEEAMRMTWDWKYNMQVSVEEMAKVYGQAHESTLREIFARRLDWAIISHSGAEIPKIVSSNDKKDDVPDGFLGGLITPDRSLYLKQVSNARISDEHKITDSSAGGIYTGAGGNSIFEVFKLYNSRRQDWDADEIKESEQDLENAYSEEIKQQHLNLESWTPEEKVKGMYTDMYLYDQTGRMLRAFPSFSLQLIDEGKWYNNFRTWDNFYGYNALHSIDVYKTRKIAADTAVIQMSNMYGGLTSKRQDMEYEDLNLPSFFSSQFWEQYVFGNPTEDTFRERKEIFNSMMLETGARLHLRMGYGSDARALPVVFNGTITEVNAGDIVEIVAQGDGLELTNVIGGGEDDTNKELFKIIEPSDYIGKLMTSKGNWLKDAISAGTDGKFFKESPLGIAHFGSTIEAPQGTWNPFSSEYGESVQNVYSQNGQMTKEQWLRTDGGKVGVIEGMLGGVMDGSFFNPKDLTSDYDEDNIRVKLYGNTPWDIIQTFALCSNDYIAGVFPFQFRSSLFFGKPHWPVTYDYDMEYYYDEALQKWQKRVLKQHMKTFMQAHIYSSQYNIVKNDIRVSAEGVYNNVIVSYDGRTAGPVQADSDIRLDQQRTTMVEANIMGKMGSSGSGVLDILGKNYWTAESQALRYGYSTVRDYMKDMYKGSYTVLGDPTVKPHDVCSLSDMVQDIQGVHQVKAVHHSMSMETGFVSIIEPDVFVTNWDAELLFMPDKVFAVGKNVIFRSSLLFAEVGAGAFLGGSVMGKMISFAKEIIQHSKGSATVQNAFSFMGSLSKNIQLEYYYKLGEMTNNHTIISLTNNLKNLGKVDGPDYIRIQGELTKIRDGLKTSKDTYKKAVKLSKEKGLFAKGLIDDASEAQRLGQLVMDNQALYKEMFDAGDNIDELITGFRDAKKAGQLINATEFATKLGTTGATVAGKAGTIAKSVVMAPAFWSIIVSAVIEVLTSGLVEMWTRKKQNAECVKVVPLQYRGKNWTAGMTGHRGGVWGDVPSLGDKYMNTTWFRKEDGFAKNIWNLFPIVMNFMEGSNYADEIDEYR